MFFLAESYLKGNNILNFKSYSYMGIIFGDLKKAFYVKHGFCF